MLSLVYVMRLSTLIDVCSEVEHIWCACHIFEN